MDQIQTMRTKTDKLESLILEEHDNLKECLMELDLLKQKLMTNSINRPQEQLYEAVTSCHKCDIRQTDSSKKVDKKLDKSTKLGVQANHPTKAGHITTLQITKNLQQNRKCEMNTIKK